jgi:hypothetical protein
MAADIVVSRELSSLQDEFSVAQSQRCHASPLSAPQSLIWHSFATFEMTLKIEVVRCARPHRSKERVQCLSVG